MRLSAATADRLPHFVARPEYDRDAQGCGIVHLGIGAFHRAHQAVYTDAAMAAGDCDWAITGVSLRSGAVRDALAPQDGLYTVTERDGTGERIRLIGAVRRMLVAPEDPAAVTRALADAAVRVVTLTVTEKGYHQRPDGSLDFDGARATGGTIYHHLAAGLAARRAAGLSGLTLVSCDNLPGNGAALARGLGKWLDAEDRDARRWFERECACPSTMVDRIVPGTTAADRARVEAATGLTDEAAVVTEPFHQWVIEDRFAGPRPRWEAARARFVTDVRPFELAKLRLLNGAHSALAYLGLTAGHRTVDQAVADPSIRPVVERLMRVEAAATIPAAPGQDLPRYADALLARFANAALPHALAQIASDGSQKIGPRWLAPLADHAARGEQCPATLAALAAWLRHVRGDDGPVDDPLSARLAALWRTEGEGGIVAALFGPAGLFAATWVATANDSAFLRKRLAASPR